MDIIKELNYTLNGSEVAFFGVVLQNEKGKIKPTYIIMGVLGIVTTLYSAWKLIALI